MSENQITVYVVAHSAEEVQSGLLFDDNQDAVRYAEEEGMRVYAVEATLHFDTANLDASYVRRRLQYLSREIEAERISTTEIIELQGLAEFIEPGDVKLLEWAGVSEFPETLGPEQVEKLAHEWALSHGIHSYDDINDDIMEQFSISFEAADQITEFLDAHAATATLTFGPVA